MKKFLLYFLFAGMSSAGLFGNEYYKVLAQAEAYIDKIYKEGSIAHKRAKKDLEKIDAMQDSNEVKIATIKNSFSKAFAKEEKPLIFQKEISCEWHINQSKRAD